MVHFSSPKDYIVQFDMLSDAPQMHQDLAIISIKNQLFYTRNQRYCKIIHKNAPVFVRENGLPYPEDLKELKILSKKQSKPSKAVEKRVYFESIECVPYARFHCLYREICTKRTLFIYCILA